MKIDAEFLIQVGAIFTVLWTIIKGIFAYNKDRFKVKLDDGNVKRKEVSDLLQKLYDDSQADLKQTRKDHALEIEQVRKDCAEQIRVKEEKHDIEIEKRDLIIKEIIKLLPPADRATIEQKIVEIKNSTV